MSKHRTEPRIIIARDFPRDPGLRRQLVLTKRRLDRWFGLRLDPPNVVIVPNRKLINRFWGTRQPNWLVGWYQRQTIYVAAEQTAKRSHGQWLKLVAHEHAHLYISRLGQGRIPTWFNEGLAMILAGQTRRDDWVAVRTYFRRPRRTDDPLVYTAGWTIIRRLIRRYGQRRFRRFLALAGQPIGWQEAFLKVYRQTWKSFLGQGQ